MADRYAPALLLDVLAFWFVLRWLLTARMILLVGWLLVLMMVVGALDTVAHQHYVWALFFAAAALLAWTLMRRWQRPGLPAQRRRRRLSPGHAWRRLTSDEIGVSLRATHRRPCRRGRSSHDH
jgi:hypothetical protein